MSAIFPPPFTPNVTARSSNGTLLSTENVVLASGTITLTLPTAVGFRGFFSIKMTGSGVVTIDGAGTETIDGALTYVLRDTGGGITIVSDNANWQVVGTF